MPAPSLTVDDVKARIAALQERVKIMEARDGLLVELKAWMEKNDLSTNDLLWMYRNMKPQRAERAVRTSRPLQPTGQKTTAEERERGLVRVNGQLIEAKGDPAFREAIRAARAERKLSSVQAGAKLGVSAATITNWESGRNVPHDETRQKILRFYKLPPGLGAEATAEMLAARNERQEQPRGPANGRADD